MKRFLLLLTLLFSLATDAPAQVWQAFDNCFSISLQDTVSKKKYTYAKSQLQVYLSNGHLQLQRSNSPVTILATWDSNTVHAIAPSLSSGYDLVSGWLMNSCVNSSGGGSDTIYINGGTDTIYIGTGCAVCWDTADIYTIVNNELHDVVTAGNYTPVLSNVQNADSTTFFIYPANFSVIKDVVNVDGILAMSDTLPGAGHIIFTLSLPFPTYKPSTTSPTVTGVTNGVVKSTAGVIITTESVVFPTNGAVFWLNNRNFGDNLFSYHFTYRKQ